AGIVDTSPASGPKIDSTWFPNTQANTHWTSSPAVGLSGNAWRVAFSNGVVWHNTRNYGFAVRLVRASQ
ncbi:MAG: DUF1566 domain-containing protein, partial [Rhodoferax sp.]|nr:DUF1566 domain-containing protein [Rhodoferax sp.]